MTSNAEFIRLVDELLNDHARALKNLFDPPGFARPPMDEGYSLDLRQKLIPAVRERQERFNECDNAAEINYEHLPDPEALLKAGKDFMLIGIYMNVQLALGRQISAMESNRCIVWMSKAVDYLPAWFWAFAEKPHLAPTGEEE